MPFISQLMQNCIALWVNNIKQIIIGVLLEVSTKFIDIAIGK